MEKVQKPSNSEGSWLLAKTPPILCLRKSTTCFGRTTLWIALTRPSYRRICCRNWNFKRYWDIHISGRLIPPVSFFFIFFTCLRKPFEPWLPVAECSCFFFREPVAAIVDAQTETEVLNRRTSAASHSAHLMPLIRQICLNIMKSGNCLIFKKVKVVLAPVIFLSCMFHGHILWIFSLHQWQWQKQWQAH
jgi:hypothetical protein